MGEAREDSELATDLAGVTFNQLRQLLLTSNHPAILSTPGYQSHGQVITQVSLMTFSNVVISTSVKIWSISGMSRAPLEAKEEISLGQRAWPEEQEADRGGGSWAQQDHTKKKGSREYSLEENARVVEEIIQS